jgi:hypothetical protein
LAFALWSGLFGGASSPQDRRRGILMHYSHSLNAKELQTSDKRKALDFQGLSDGHGWARTSDLSRVKRLPSAVRRRRFTGSLAMFPVSRWVVHSSGLLGFIAVLVHRIGLWTTGGALVTGVSLSSGLDRSEGVTGRA